MPQYCISLFQWLINPITLLHYNHGMQIEYWYFLTYDFPEYDLFKHTNWTLAPFPCVNVVQPHIGYMVKKYKAFRFTILFKTQTHKIGFPYCKLINIFRIRDFAWNWVNDCIKTVIVAFFFCFFFFWNIKEPNNEKHLQKWSNGLSLTYLSKTYPQFNSSMQPFTLIFRVCGCVWNIFYMYLN